MAEKASVIPGKAGDPDGRYWARFKFGKGVYLIHSMLEMLTRAFRAERI